jgi:hypothetical protein
VHELWRGQDVVDVHCGCGATSAERRRLLVRVSRYKFQSLSNIVIAQVDYVHMIFKINCMIFIFLKVLLVLILIFLSCKIVLIFYSNRL